MCRYQVLFTEVFKGKDMKTIKLIHGYEAQVDDEDYVYLSQFNWNYHKDRYTGYAINDKLVRMHRLIMQPPKGMVVDHIDGNGLNNCRSNLRICTNQENLCNKRKYKNNKSGFKGVSWRKQCSKWRAYIQINNKQKHLGYFKTAELAYEEYCKASKLYHKEFGRIK